MPPSSVGIILSILAISFGIATGAIVKFIADDVNLAVTLFYRFLLSVPLLLLAAFIARGRDFYKVNAKKTLVIRIILGMSGIVFWFLSVRYLPLGLSTAVMHSAVIYVAMLSPLVLGERVGIYRWSAVVIGLLGVFVISGVFTATFETAIFLAVAASLSSGGLQLALRRLGKSDAPATIATWYNSMGAVIMGVVFIIVPSLWVLPEPHLFPYLILLGILGSGLQICFTAAFQYVDAVVIATTRYLQVPMAAILGYFLFQEVPTLIHYMGAFLIVGSCIVIVLREFQRRKSAQG